MTPIMAANVFHPLSYVSYMTATPSVSATGHGQQQRHQEQSLYHYRSTTTTVGVTPLTVMYGASSASLGPGTSACWFIGASCAMASGKRGRGRLV